MGDSPITGEELFRRCAGSRDREAWTEFHRRYHSTIAGVVVKTARLAQSALVNEIEDLIHEVYVRLAMRGGRALLAFTPAGPHSEFAYLKVIARNVVLDRLSRLSKEPEPSVEVDQEAQAGNCPRSGAEALERKLLIDRVEQIVRANAAERDQTVFWLYFRTGLTAAQISAYRSIGLTTSGVESAILRLVRLVRDGLGGGGRAKGEGKG
jgi:RNA polymerase sigma factor (sigma-70 family)